MRGRRIGPLRKEAHDMRTTSIRQRLPLIGMGVMLAGLFGGPASAADVELFVYQNDSRYQNPYGYQHPWGQQDYRGQYDPWSQDRWGYRHDRRRHNLPNRYTIQKGKKCELQCERIRGSREYRCREYRC
jgi:hypothetical protein